MKVGVLGLGYLGMPIASALHEKGHDVISWTRSERKTLWKNSTDLSLNPATTCDAIVIASGSARPGFGDDLSEIQSTVNNAQKLHLRSTPHIYYISSGAVYGECPKPLSENDLASPSTLYGKAKLAAEKAFEETFNGRFSALRVGNVVDWENPYGIFREISRLSPENCTLNFFGGAESSRDYLEIGHFVAFVTRTIQAEVTPPILNIGSGNSLSLSLLAQKLSNIPDLEINIRWHEGRAQDVQVTQLDTKLLRSLHGSVNADFESGLENFLREILKV